ncbi:HlyD family type I secretion periplasmic adaptor subunit [Bradyrhizobium ivorense]|uniref:HlyD family type I secretion periplasmic adaptor subunit n=1 Tax=Bradyrhizobium ivorense TaxID=2511166 RepID=UPI0027E2CA43|nr:HlyD family type I secretion periplasmic adaptor subunit [Bradyrhizobium ivorense]
MEANANGADTKTPIEDPGFHILNLLLRLIGVGAEPGQLRRDAASPMGVKQMLQYARAAGCTARSAKLPWTRLAGGPLPAIAVLRNGSFLLLGKVSGDTAIVLAPDAERPTLMTQDQFEAVWDGRLVVVKRRGALAAQVEQTRAAAVRQLQQLWKTSLTRANDISRNVIDGRRNIVKADARNEEPSSAAASNGGIIVFADHARRLGRAVARIGPGEERRRHDELAFLPAALEIVETPPSPLGRATAFAIAAIFAAAVAWACLGTVDIVAISPGKLIPSGRTKTIQPFETGVVRAIKVRDGEAVKSGDVLIELDTTMTAAELSRLKGDLLSAQLDVARTKAALARNEDPVGAFVPPADATPAQVEMHRRFLVSQTAEQNAKLAAIDQQVKQKEAERATFEASVEKIKATLAPLQQRVEIRQQLFQKELGSKLTYLTEYQELVAQQQEISVMQRRSSEADAAIAVLMETRTKAIAEYERGLFEGLAKAEEKAAGLTQEAVKAEQRTSLQRLTAPIDGVVQQLAVHTIGGVVTPAQMLMLIVPSESRLEIEAMVSNRDIGFVEPGQDAAIKIDTFNFTRYGLLQGKVLSISQDAITRNKPTDKGSETSAGAEATSSEPKGQELVYAARLSIDRSQMEIENKRVNLSPGMAVTVEIKTGSRRIISYLLSPLARYKQESLRER